MQILIVMYLHCLGRIDRKIEFPLPDEKTRRRIFQIHTKKMTLADDLDLEEYITAKDDLSGADIKVLYRVEKNLGQVSQASLTALCVVKITVYMYMYHSLPCKCPFSESTHIHVQLYMYSIWAHK